MANVTVMGVMREAGGLRESLAKTRKHNQEVGDALLNVSGIGTANGEEAEPDDPRPAYVPQPWPMLIYHPDGRDVLVVDKDGLKRAETNGFRVEPYPKPQVQVNDPATEKKALMDTNAQLQGQITQQADRQAKQDAEMAELRAMVQQLSAKK